MNEKALQTACIESLLKSDQHHYPFAKDTLCLVANFSSGDMDETAIHDALKPLTDFLRDTAPHGVRTYFKQNSLYIPFRSPIEGLNIKTKLLDFAEWHGLAVEIEPSSLIQECNNHGLIDAAKRVAGRMPSTNSHRVH